MKTKSAHGTKFHQEGVDHMNNSVLIEGKTKVQLLINFLMKEQQELSSLREFPPTIVSDRAFVGSTVKTNQIRTVQDILIIGGIILPTATLHIHRLIKETMVKRAQSEYSCEFLTEKHTKGSSAYGNVNFITKNIFENGLSE